MSPDDERSLLAVARVSGSRGGCVLRVLSTSVLVALSALAAAVDRAAAEIDSHVSGILFFEPCQTGIDAALAQMNGDVGSVFREDEKAAAYGLLLGLGLSLVEQGGAATEVIGVGVGAAIFYCKRNPDVSLYDVARLLAREG